MKMVMTGGCKCPHYTYYLVNWFLSHISGLYLCQLKEKILSFLETAGLLIFLAQPQLFLGRLVAGASAKKCGRLQRWQDLKMTPWDLDGLKMTILPKLHVLMLSMCVIAPKFEPLPDLPPFFSDLRSHGWVYGWWLAATKWGWGGGAERWHWDIWRMLGWACATQFCSDHWEWLVIFVCYWPSFFDTGLVVWPLKLLSFLGSLPQNPLPPWDDRRLLSASSLTMETWTSGRRPFFQRHWVHLLFFARLLLVHSNHLQMLYRYRIVSYCIYICKC